MKTEDFDDAIRKKVNSIYHTYKEDDIEKIHTYLSRKRGTALKMRWAKTAGVAFAAVAMAGSLIWNINQFRDKKEMAQRIDSLENSLAQSPRIILKTDTVYLSGNQFQNSNNANTSTNNNLVLNQSDNNKNIAENSPKNNLNITEKDNDGSQEENVSGGNFSRNNSTEKVEKRNNAIVNNTKNRNKLNNTNSGNLSGQKLAENNNNRKFNNENFIADSVSENKNNTTKNRVETKEQDPIKSIAIVDSPYIANEKNALDSVTEETSVVNTKAKPQGLKTAEENHKKKPWFTAKKFNYNVGISVEKANHQAAIGLVGQVFFTDRIGINTGVKFLNFGEDRFRNPREFNERERRDFREVCGPDFKGDLDSVENIHRRTMVIQIPVSVTYMLPLKNSFGLTFSAGTDIDIAGMQRIGFERKLHNEPKGFQDLAIKIPVAAFNNAVLSAGAQKRWGNFLMQANLFSSPQLKRVEYKKDKIYSGLNLKLLYSF